MSPRRVPKISGALAALWVLALTSGCATSGPGGTGAGKATIRATIPVPKVEYVEGRSEASNFNGSNSRETPKSKSQAERGTPGWVYPLACVPFAGVAVEPWLNRWACGTGADSRLWAEIDWQKIEADRAMADQYRRMMR